MKKTIITLACCALLAPLAFAQAQQTTTTTTVETVTVTGTIVTESEGGSATNYQPPNTLVIREDSSNKPGRYVLNGPGNVVNKRGEPVRSPVKPGTRVQIYYTNVGGQRVIDHVIVLD
jgi:hypothetical protein